ncbi:MAG: hypothetical protein RIG68_17055 [Imperialibacter sp.]|uniref:hypothetical protein n=1 Tax=Imperialibacter sp. TaxID=2038411 RepID=UPI0032EF9D53
MKYAVTKLLSLLTLLIMTTGCGGDDSGQPNGVGKISFKPKFDNQSANGGRVLDLSEAVSILVTINKSDGSPTEYSTSEIELYQLDGEFISQKISLPVGDYKLTEFLILDEDSNIIYAAPEEGSLQAQNVNEPLPIEFSISADDILDLEVEVLSTENLGLEDFGLVGFDLSLVDLFRFYINVSEKGNLETLLSAELIVTSESYSFHQELAPIANNSIVIKDGYASYDLTIEHEGYETFNFTFSRDSLGHYSSTPLTVELTARATEQTIQERLDDGETPISIYNSGVSLDQLYGASYQGGLISYLNTDNGIGFVCANMDQATNIEWGCADIEITGDQGTLYVGERNLVGGGALNTPEIVNDCNEENSAAKICYDLELEGYDDWYLPAREELELMKANLHLNGLGDFINERYWTSNELNSGVNPPLVRVINFSDAAGGATWKTQLCAVRAIRYF